MQVRQRSSWAACLALAAHTQRGPAKGAMLPLCKQTLRCQGCVMETWLTSFVHVSWNLTSIMNGEYLIRPYQAMKNCRKLCFCKASKHGLFSATCMEYASFRLLVLIVFPFSLRLYLFWPNKKCYVQKLVLMLNAFLLHFCSTLALLLCKLQCKAIMRKSLWCV